MTVHGEIARLAAAAFLETPFRSYPGQDFDIRPLSREIERYTDFKNKRQRSRRKWLRFPLRRWPICTYREDEVDKSLDIRRLGGRITSITLKWKRVRS